MNIVDGYIGSSGGRVGALFFQDFGKKIFGNSHAVIRNQKKDRILFHPARENNAAGLTFLLPDSMKDGVFYDGLQGEPGDGERVQLIGKINDELYGIVEADVLQIYIERSMLSFLFYGGVGHVLAQGQFVETGQFLDCFTDFLRLSGQGHPVDGVHSVVEKMRVNLSLEGIDFCDSQLIGNLLKVICQFLLLPGRVIVG